jgi:hypothetical protein
MEMWEEKESFFYKKKKASHVVLQEKWISAAGECEGSFIKRGCGKL